MSMQSNATAEGFTLCSLLASADTYHPDTLDLNQDLEAKHYWFGCFTNMVMKFERQASASQPKDDTAKARAQAFRENCIDEFHQLQNNQRYQAGASVLVLLSATRGCWWKFFKEIRQLDNELLNQRRAQERERQAQLGSERQAAALAATPSTVTVLATSPPPSSSSSERTLRQTGDSYYSDGSTVTIPGRMPPSTSSTEEKSPLVIGGKSPLLEETVFGGQTLTLTENLHCSTAVTPKEVIHGRRRVVNITALLQIRTHATTTPGLRYKNLGKSGLRVSNVGLGTWPIFSPGVSEEQAEAILRLAVDSGINLFDLSEAHSGSQIMEAYTNCRQFNCVTPIVEQSEYHMFCREKAELYLPEMYNKIGVGFMAWGPLSMCLGDAQGGDKLWIPKGSLKSKSQSYSWIEDEVTREVSLVHVRLWCICAVQNHLPLSFYYRNIIIPQDEVRRLYDKARDISNLAEKLGCNTIQLSIAWSLKHEPVQCLLLGATSPEQLHQSLQALQLLPRLSTGVMLEIERILENKPVRPPPISTLALRLESLLFEQAALDSKFNNSATATGTLQSTSSTVSTTSGLANPPQTGTGGEIQAQQLVNCLKSIDTTLLGEKKFRYRISCSFRALDSNCKSLFNFLRGKGTTNGVAPAKPLTVASCAKPSSTDSVPLAPNQNAVEVVDA
ncbi:hypothetical protein ZHAS_00012854 [Anopheles sinensis]|uniref:NADP-dependent oxidoreductase domain-containing protein n=1 Tax=Anopheles sinensis TaxID=74873 RepID=A0A084W3Z9_ANOSI|nr:hypothetical protein ZHAS_00012854 [Anopheles sinensis]